MTLKRVLTAGALVAATIACTARAPAPAERESAIAARMDSLRGDTTALLSFLQAMPKGGDLHNHLSGDIAPESTIRWAAEDGFCVDTATMTILGKPCAAGGTRVLASKVATDSALRRRAIAAWSMQDFRPGKETGADHFFATFLKVGPVEAVRLGDMLAEVVSRAATDHVSYVELMLDPDNQRVAPLGTKVGRYAGFNFNALRQRLDSAGLGDTIRAAARHLDSAEARAETLMHCGSPNAAPGCDVTVRYIYYSIRAFPPEMAFAQLLAGFEWPGIDPRFVAVNMVAPEHNATAVKDFKLHMAMVAQLHPVFPGVGITLHAGELSEAVTTRDVMRSHIRRSVEAGARRIGHGVDVMQEDSAEALLKELHDRDVLVEICLTSNDVILGVTGAKHPLQAYLSHGVPVALGTDDEGVSRSDMTHEYLRAVLDQHVDYATLKKMARNSLTHAFVDDATKRRLVARFDADIAAFERRQ